MATEPWKRLIAYFEANPDQPGADIMLEIYRPLPWMVHVQCGSYGDDKGMQDAEMRDWCYRNAGKNAWVGDKDGAWHRSNVTIHGWTDFAFATEDAMNRFIEAFPGLTSFDEDPRDPHPTTKGER